MNTAKTITAQQFAPLHEQGSVDLIDVRTPVEFRAVHATAAQNIPLDALDPHRVMETHGRSADKPLYVICKSGARGEKARQKFADAGFANVVNVEGGTDAWIAAGQPVVRGRKAVSLERQVRIAAGFLVLVGAVLSFWNIYFVCLSGFVGAGLIFAGITDTCGMGMLLARMPWNQVTDSTCCTPNSNQPAESAQH